MPGRGQSTPSNPPSRPGVLGQAREAIRRNPRADKAYRTTVGVVGGGTVALGVVLMPLPGPGALVALGGLAVLGTEFEGAKKVRDSGVKLASQASAQWKSYRAKRSPR